MRYQVLFSLEAASDLDNVFSYIAFDLLSPETAENLITTIEKEIESLRDYPFRCALVPDEDWNRYGIREMTVKNYCVYYIFEKFYFH